MQYEDSVNLYAAMANNPVSYRDPTGRKSLTQVFTDWLRKTYSRNGVTKLSEVLPEGVMEEKHARQLGMMVSQYGELKMLREAADNRIDNLRMIAADSLNATERRAASIKQIKSLVAELDLKVRDRRKLADTSFKSQQWGTFKDGSEKSFATVEDIGKGRGYNPVRTDEKSMKLFVDSDLVRQITHQDGAEQIRAIEELASQLDHDLLAHAIIPLVGGKNNIPKVRYIRETIDQAGKITINPTAVRSLSEGVLKRDESLPYLTHFLDENF
jgi:hypothetical protein